MSAMASQTASHTIDYPSVYSGADQRESQSSTSLALLCGIQWRLVNPPQKGPVTRKMFPFYDVIMATVHSENYAPALLTMRNVVAPVQMKQPWSTWVKISHKADRNSIYQNSRNTKPLFLSLSFSLSFSLSLFLSLYIYIYYYIYIYIWDILYIK